MRRQIRSLMVKKRLKLIFLSETRQGTGWNNCNSKRPNIKSSEALMEAMEASIVFFKPGSFFTDSTKSDFIASQSSGFPGADLNFSIQSTKDDCAGPWDKIKE